MKQTTDDIYDSTQAARFENAECAYFSSGECRSCDLLGVASGSRLYSKLAGVRSALLHHGLPGGALRGPILPSHPWESRRKIKMAVSGTSKVPVLGIVRGDQSSADLRNCSLMPKAARDLLATLSDLIAKHDLRPYDIAARKGELKYIIIMATQDLSQGILRFVTRSTEAIPRIRKALAAIQGLHPWVRVISCNIQPQPAAILEGDEEIILTEACDIMEQCGSIPLILSPRSFMQVTPEIAVRLYSTACDVASQLGARHVLDLFCGVGGFSLHVASVVDSVIGVELSESAISNARKSAALLGYQHTSFHASDVELFLSQNTQLRPDLVIVNPPRRGLSANIITHIAGMIPQTILYSSCNPETFARDAATLSAHYVLREAIPFDMFPMTGHCEVLGVFSKA